MLQSFVHFLYPTLMKIMTNQSRSRRLQHNLDLLIQGEEKALKFFYDLYGNHIYYRSRYATGDVCQSENIVQECFLKLWMLRHTLESGEDVLLFLRRYARDSINKFYQISRNRFNRNLLRLDGIEEWEQFMLGHQDEEEADLYGHGEETDTERKEQMEKVNGILPSLGATQRLFVELCLRYSFSYERIADHLGGISEYTVAKKVEEVIEKLRSLLMGMQKIDAPILRAKMVVSGGLSEQQQDILRIRHELGLTFDEIAQQISLPPTEVRRLFLEAHLNVGKKTG